MTNNYEIIKNTIIISFLVGFLCSPIIEFTKGFILGIKYRIENRKVQKQFLEAKKLEFEIEKLEKEVLDD